MSGESGGKVTFERIDIHSEKIMLMLILKETGLESVHADLSISEWAMLAGFCGYGIDTSDFIQIAFLGSD